ncbi:MAG TPA: hypothetical protein VFU34_06270 [Gaiellaceae bacterium]|nr:hypothetical protein [Gaiellaceae bacterium]
MPRGPKRELPPPLPPERRTVGQLVAETIRVYGRNFIPALPLGIFVGVVNQLTADISRVGVGLVLVVAAPAFAGGYAYATRIATGAHAPLRAWAIAIMVGSLVFLPAALLFPWFALAGVFWLALFGLVVPAAVVERASFGDSLRRGLALGRVDYVHAAGSLATLVILFFLTRLGLALLLESQADNTVRTAIFLSDTVLAPLLFLGGAILYGDQEARLRSRGEARAGRKE